MKNVLHLIAADLAVHPESTVSRPLMASGHPWDHDVQDAIADGAQRRLHAEIRMDAISGQSA